MIYVTDGSNYLECSGLIPDGCWEITKQVFDSAAADRAELRAQYRAEFFAARAELRASAKAKLLAGEPLTEAEADLLLGG
jgi:hypothetical protein